MNNSSTVPWSIAIFLEADATSLLKEQMGHCSSSNIRAFKQTFFVFALFLHGNEGSSDIRCSNIMFCGCFL